MKSRLPPPASGRGLPPPDLPAAAASRSPRVALLPELVAALRSAGCVYAEEEAHLLISSTQPEDLGACLARRVAGVPLEYVLGWADFHGLRIELQEGVFIPRRRSEFLVALATEIVREGDLVLDLCCGSGALAAAVATALGGRLEIWASDIDPAAVRCAQHNLAGFFAHVVRGDLYESLPSHLEGRIGVIVANAPYVPTHEIALLPREARLHEPHGCLDGGADGLAVQRRIAADAQRWLGETGVLLVETSIDAAAQAAEAVRACGLAARVASSEALDAAVVIGPPSGRGWRAAALEARFGPLA